MITGFILGILVAVVLALAICCCSARLWRYSKDIKTESRYWHHKSNDDFNTKFRIRYLPLAKMARSWNDWLCNLCWPRSSLEDRPEEEAEPSEEAQNEENEFIEMQGRRDQRRRHTREANSPERKGRFSVEGRLLPPIIRPGIVEFIRSEPHTELYLYGTQRSTICKM